MKNTSCIKCVRIGGDTCPYCIDALREKNRVRDCSLYITLDELKCDNVQLNLFD